MNDLAALVLGMLPAWGHLLIAILYLTAGRQTFWLVMLMDPEPENCPITKAVAEGRLPYPVYAAFLLFWPAFMLGGWLASRKDVTASVATRCADAIKNKERT